MEEKITILGWDKFNPRKDLKSMPWLRIDNNMAFDEKFLDFDSQEMWVWMFLLMQAAQKNCDTYVLNRRYVEKFAKVDLDKVDSAIAKLLDAKCILINTPRTNPIESDRVINDPCTDPIESVPYERTNERTERNGTERTNGVGGDVSADAEPLAFVLDDSDLNAIFSEKKILARQWSAWVKAFPDANWVAQEIKKAFAWELSSPANKKKRFAAFITRWLGRGWDTRKRDTTPAIAKTPVDICQRCKGGLIYAVNKSTGFREWTSCDCSAGRAKQNYLRFDANRFDVASLEGA